MSSELIADSGPTFCQVCLMTFSNNQDLNMHCCDTKIKQEDQDGKDESENENKVHIFKPALDMVEIKMEESDGEENKPLQNFENDENVPISKMKKTRKKKHKKLLQPLELSDPTCNIVVQILDNFDFTFQVGIAIIDYVT